MSTSDSTGDKLVASVRKTKNSTSRTPKITKKRVVKKSTSRSINPQTTGKKLKSEKKQLVDLFQHGRRVWPD